MDNYYSTCKPEEPLGKEGWGVTEEVLHFVVDKKVLTFDVEEMLRFSMKRGDTKFRRTHFDEKMSFVSKFVR